MFALSILQIFFYETTNFKMSAAASTPTSFVTFLQVKLFNSDALHRKRVCKMQLGIRLRSFVMHRVNLYFLGLSSSLVHFFLCQGLTAQFLS